MKVESGIRVKAFDVMHRAVEDGVNYGWRRAHKHAEAPIEMVVKNEIMTAVINSLCDYFDFIPEEE